MHPVFVELQEKLTVFVDKLELELKNTNASSTSHVILDTATEEVKNVNFGKLFVDTREKSAAPPLSHEKRINIKNAIHKIKPILNLIQTQKIDDIGDNLDILENYSKKISSIIFDFLYVPNTRNLHKLIELMDHFYNLIKPIFRPLSKEDLNILIFDLTKIYKEIDEKLEKPYVFELECEDILEKCRNTLKKCEEAFSTSTTVGLAAAFQERSIKLGWSVRWWTIGLVVVLGFGGWFSYKRLEALSELFKNPDLPIGLVVLNLLLQTFSVGASVWFAWLATKQINQRFKLAEDYAFKASVARSYEGLRKQTEQVDPALTQKLLTSLLARLDDLPVRLMDTQHHGSPMHELASGSASLMKGDVGQLVQKVAEVVEKAKPSP